MESFTKKLFTYLLYILPCQFSSKISIYNPTITEINSFIDAKPAPDWACEISIHSQSRLCLQITVTSQRHIRRPLPWRWAAPGFAVANGRRCADSISLANHPWLSRTQLCKDTSVIWRIKTQMSVVRDLGWHTLKTIPICLTYPENLPDFTPKHSKPLWFEGNCWFLVSKMQNFPGGGESPLTPLLGTFSTPIVGPWFYWSKSWQHWDCFFSAATTAFLVVWKNWPKVFHPNKSFKLSFSYTEKQQYEN